MEHLAYISDQRFYWDGRGWYTTNGFPLQDIFHHLRGKAPRCWTFFGRLTSVTSVPPKALPIERVTGLEIRFAGPWNLPRGVLGYLAGLAEYVRELRRCLQEADVVWLKSNFFASWVASFLPASPKALLVSHQVGDPAMICVGAGPYRGLLRKLASALTMNVHRACQVNVFVSEYLAQKYAVPGREKWIINESRLRPHHIISPESVRPSLHAPVRLAYVGRLSVEKGVHVLIDALPHLAFDYRLWVVGEGERLSALRRRAALQGCLERLQFLGYVPWGDELFGLLRQADLLVVPSLTEGCPLVVLEGMAAGVPVIASNVGGMAELIDHGRTGLLFRPGDSEALARVISECVSDEDLRMRIARGAAVAVHRHTLDEQLMRMFSLLVDRQRAFREPGTQD